MKQIYYMALMLMVALTGSATLVSCGDDDDDSSVDSRVFGTWHSTIYEVWEYKDDVLVVHWEDLDDEKYRFYEIVDGKETGGYQDYQKNENDKYWDEITFKSDGTFSTIDKANDSSHGTFATSERVMTIITDDGIVKKFPYELNGGQLTITMDGRADQDENGYAYYTIAHYQKK